MQGDKTDANPAQATSGFRRFPSWIWRNADVLDFIGWLRAYNTPLEQSEHVGFYGLDVYSLHASMECVLRYLDQADPNAAYRARLRYACFDQFGDDPQVYSYAADLGLRASLENEAVSQLLDLQRNSLCYARLDGLHALDRFFDADQHARAVKHAEHYYRAIFRRSVLSWNLRDQHMVETLDALVNHLGAPSAKIAVWAHNSHLGDARATEMGETDQVLNWPTIA